MTTRKAQMKKLSEILIEEVRDLKKKLAKQQKFISNLVKRIDRLENKNANS